MDVACPDDAQLDAFVEGGISASGHRAVQDHLQQCWECRETVAELARSSGRAPVVAPEAAGPSQLLALRFAVLELLGRGGMGAVYSAYDTVLDRRVAIKSVGLQNLAANAQELLKTEAMALAKVSHPNVVPVHDVLFHQGAALLVMELVEGTTLDAWCKAHHPSAEQVLAVLVQAGQGLQAAHDAGIVHGDVKPTNVLVRSDGRACLIDFGLARWTATHSHPPTQPHQDLGCGGTPAYMAPEQQQAGTATPLSDQFSFCATVVEILWGVRAAAGTPAATLTRLEAPGQRPTTGRVPKGAVHALSQGLSTVPEERHASMAPLLQALAARPQRRVARWLWGAAAVAAMGGTAALHFQTRASCQAAAGDVTQVMAGAMHEQAAQRFLGSNPAIANIWKTAQADLSAFAAQWSAARNDECGQLRPSPAATACLRRSLVELEVFLSNARPSATVLERGLQPGAQLTRAQSCVTDAPPRPADPAAGQKADAIDDQLAKADGLIAAGANKEAVAEAARAAAAADALGYPPLRQRAYVRMARSAMAAGDYAQSEAAWWQAVSVAMSLGYHDAAQLGLCELSKVIGALRGRNAEAERVNQLALALVDQTSDRRRAELLHHYSAARVARSSSRYKEAEEHVRSALALVASGVQAPWLTSWDLHNELGASLLLLGRRSDALPEFEAAVAQMTQRLGDNHPLLGASLTNVGLALRGVGQTDRALQMLLRAEAICRDTVGTDHARSWPAMNNVAELMMDLGRFDEAAQRYNDCKAAAGRVAGVDHPVTLLCTKGLADAQQAMGNHAQAEALYRDALARFLVSLGANHTYVASTRVALSRTLVALAHAPEALDLAEEGLAERVRNQREPLAVAEAQAAVSLALRALGRDPTRADLLMTHALTAFAAHGTMGHRHVVLLEKLGGMP